MTAVDARFAGGTILVQVDEEYTGDHRVMVRVDMPGHTLHLFRHEARDLANALREAAAEAGDILNRRPEADAA
ncbi:hypothetical protein [Microbacterium sp. Root53]|uniref:hypothetical protein n=1 Tax=Microbacterium sp. Root53 TaxID=1736553 RepID=UPI000AAA4F98|nr:hypothetical protein [Microbacterium sp. Root53]